MRTTSTMGVVAGLVCGAVMGTAQAQSVPQPCVVLEWFFLDANLNEVTQLEVGDTALAVCRVTFDGIVAQAQNAAQLYGAVANVQMNVNFDGPTALSTDTFRGDTTGVLFSGFDLGFADGLRGVGFGGLLQPNQRLLQAFVAAGSTSDFLTFTNEPTSAIFGGFEFTATEAGLVSVGAEAVQVAAGVFAGTQLPNGVRLDPTNGVSITIASGVFGQSGKVIDLGGSIEVVPAPAVMGVFGVAGLAGARRRR